MPNLPLLIPVLVIGAVVTVVGYRSVARWLGCPRWAAGLLLASLAVIVAVTLTPQDGEASGSPRATVFAWLLALLGDRGLNVVMFVPLGVAVMLVGSGQLRVGAVLAGFALPWVVEGVQGFVEPLARGAQWQDVLDNTIGLVIGCGVGWWVRTRMVRARPNE
jgi:VanZ family protein